MPQYSRIPLEQINEPTIAARVQMNSAKFERLKSSMANPQIGQLVAIIVFPVQDGRYEIEDGHRRYLAARELRWSHMDAKVYDSAELAHEAVKVHANQHEEMSAADEASFYLGLMENGRTIDEVCELVQEKYDYVSDRVNLVLRGDAEIFKALAAGELKFSVARELNKIRDESMRRYYLEFAKDRGCTYATAKLWVSQANLHNSSAPAEPAPDSKAAPAPEPLENCCKMCGGDRDPYNLRWYQLHYYCWERVEKAIQQEGGA